MSSLDNLMEEKNSSVKSSYNTKFFSFAPDVCFDCEDSNQFCTLDNINECVSYLSNEMTTLGYSSLFESNTSVCNFINVINNLYLLLIFSKKQIKTNCELRDELVKSKSNLKSFESQKLKLSTELSKCKRYISTLKEKERQLNEKQKSFMVQLKQIKEENRKNLASLTHRDSLHRHEIRKKEHEISALKNKFRDLLSSKTQSNSKTQGFHITNYLKKSENVNKEKGGVSISENYLNNALEDYKSRMKLLKKDNSSLKHTVFNIYKLVMNFVSEKDDSIGGKFLHVNFEKLDHMSCKDIGITVENSIKEILEKIWHKYDNKISIKDDQLIGNANQILNSNFKKSHVICNGECNLETPTTATLICTKESNHLEDLLLTRDQALYDNHKKLLAKDKKRFSKAFLSLSRERLAFEEEKIDFKKQLFLTMEKPKFSKCNEEPHDEVNSLPTTPELLKSLDISPHNSIKRKLFREDSEVYSLTKDKPQNWSNVDVSKPNHEICIPLRKSVSHFSLVFKD